MNTPRPPTTPTNRTGLAWREFNALPPTPPPEVVASPSEGTSDEEVHDDLDTPVLSPVLDDSSLGPLDDVTPIVQPNLRSATFVGQPSTVAPSATPSATPPKVPVSGAPSLIAGAPSPIASPPPPATSKALLILAGAVALGAVAGFFVFLPSNKTRKEPRPVVVVATAVAPAKPEPPPPPIHVAEPVVPTEVAQPAEPVAPEANPLPPQSHVEITVQPADAVLSVDKKVVEGNPFKLDVPKRKTLHVVQAIAPGYHPFKKAVSYSNDVILDIQLERVEAPAPRVAVKAAASPPVAPPRKIETNTEVKLEPRVAPPVPSVEDFGMNLERPITKRPTKKIDETDPYAP